MKITKDEKGITLIALIITIIILLILAIVSIRAIKDGGILSKTQTAKEVYSEAEEKEKIQLAINQAAIDGLGTIKEEHLTPALNEQFGEGNWEYTKKKEGEYLVVRINASQRKYIINTDGTMETTEDIELSEESMFYYKGTVVAGFSTKGKEKINNAPKGAEVKLKIPQILSDGTKITGIEEKTFSIYNVNARDVKIENITSVEIPDGVTKIEQYTFCGCTNLSSITMTSSIQSIEKGAFNGCTSLTDVEIPESVVSIGGWAFTDCISLKNITIPNGVGSIDEWTFAQCTGLTNITIPNSVISIGDWAFYECTSLESVTIPSEIIGEDAFFRCENLKTITIGNNVKSIGERAFLRCTSLESVTIPSGIIRKGAFSYCENLKNIAIGNNVTSIEENVFSNCNITKIEIPQTVTTVGSNVFYNCKELTDIYCPGNQSKPDGWDMYWKNGTSATVHWNETMPK